MSVTQKHCWVEKTLVPFCKCAFFLFFVHMMTVISDDFLFCFKQQRGQTFFTFVIDVHCLWWEKTANVNTN